MIESESNPVLAGNVQAGIGLGAVTAGLMGLEAETAANLFQHVNPLAAQIDRSIQIVDILPNLNSKPALMCLALVGGGLFQVISGLRKTS